jgi:hypothetical protein
MGIDFFTNRFLPTQLYKPTRTAETIKELADTLNKSHIGVLFNAYNPTTGEGILFGNNAARERMKTETSISILSDQKSRDPPNRQMDGAYHRSCIVSELHNFDRVIVCRPLAKQLAAARAG